MGLCSLNREYMKKGSQGELSIYRHECLLVQFAQDQMPLETDVPTF